MPEPTDAAADRRRFRRPSPNDKSVAELVFDVSEGASSLIREEIELAKAEVTEKVGKILRGSAVGVAAGTFAFLALILVMEGFAWLLNEEVFDGKAWPGFFVEAAVFLLIAAARRLLRLPLRQGRRAAGSRAGDRRGEADQDDAAEGGRDERRPATGAALHGRRCPAARRPRSAATSTPSASDLGTLGRGAARPRHRADRLAPPGPRAQTRSWSSAPPSPGLRSAAWPCSAAAR